MKMKRGIQAADVLRRAAKVQAKAHYLLRLFVAGIGPQSTSAIEVVTDVCETYLKGRHDLEIIDIYQQPTLAKSEEVVAVPTLIRKQPLPLRRLIGNMSNQRKLLLGLDLAGIAREDSSRTVAA